jgi:GDP-4-dehydro-6-deoxy-D-mannose reductase
VLHLAAQSSVPAAFADPRGTFEVNLLGTLNLLESLRAARFGGRFLHVSSGDVYGAVPEAALPIDESHPPAPRNPYAVSKLAAELLCRQWHYSEGLDLVIARPFNHIGPGQDERFVVPALARQVAAAARGGDPTIRAGDIDVTRDFSDVRDVVRAYAALLRAGRGGATYHVSSGRETRVRDLLERLCRIAGIEARVAQDEARMRPSEQRRMAASSARLAADTGWAPIFTMERTLADILGEWKERAET